jgi:hypothetical protein
LLLFPLAGCQGFARADPLGWFLVQKGPYQLLYAPDRKLDRVLYDRDADGRADMVVRFGPNAKPSAAEIDADLDGTVERWEYFDTHGQLVKLGRARRQPGTPDEWEVHGPENEVTRRELDEDGDGAPDRTEYLSRGRVYLEELDTDQSGKPDRRLVRGAGGEILRIEVDKNEDGFWEAAIPVRR